MSVPSVPQAGRLVLLLCAAPLFLGAKGCASGQTCEQRLEAAIDSIDSVQQQHLSCERDADCVLVDTSTFCQGGCPEAVAAEGVDEVAAAVDHANRTWCQHYAEDGCGYATPSCVQVVAVCVDRQCTTQAGGAAARAPAAPGG